MTPEERIADNAAKGYIFVGEAKGLEVYKKLNEVGGYTYYGESCGVFGCIWDTALASEAEFELIAKDAYGLEFQ